MKTYKEFYVAHFYFDERGDFGYGSCIVPVTSDTTIQDISNRILEEHNFRQVHILFLRDNEINL